MVQTMTRDAGDPGSNPALGKKWSRDYPVDVPATPATTLPGLDANLRYHEALEWRNGQKQDTAYF